MPVPFDSVIQKHETADGESIMEYQMLRSSLLRTVCLTVITSALSSGAVFAQGLENWGSLGVHGTHFNFDPDNTDFPSTDIFSWQAAGIHGEFGQQVTDRTDISFRFGWEQALQIADSNDQTVSTLFGEARVTHAFSGDGSIGLFAGGGRSTDNGDNGGQPIPFSYVGFDVQKQTREWFFGIQVGGLQASDVYGEAPQSMIWGSATLGVMASPNTELALSAAVAHGPRWNETFPTAGTLDIRSATASIRHSAPNKPLVFWIEADAATFNDVSGEEGDNPWVQEARAGLTYYFGSKQAPKRTRTPRIDRWVSISANEIE